MIFFHLVSFFYLSLFASFVISQELDSDDILDRINRIEKNINDLQKFNLNDDSSNLSSGYISRNEKRLDEIETATQNNVGKLEILENRINEIEKKIELLNIDISTQLDEIKKIFQNKLSLSDPIRGSKTSNFVESESEIKNVKNVRRIEAQECGHLIPVEDPELFSYHLNGFIHSLKK